MGFRLPLGLWSLPLPLLRIVCLLVATFSNIVVQADALCTFPFPSLLALGECGIVHADGPLPNWPVLFACDQRRNLHKCPVKGHKCPVKGTVQGKGYIFYFLLFIYLLYV